MSLENVEISRKGIDAWAAGDFDTAYAVFDDDVVTRRLAPAPDPGTWRGREALLKVVADWVGMFEEFKMHGEEFLDAGDQVVMRVAQEGRGRGSTVPVKATFWFVHTLRDGKVVNFDMYATRSQAFEAAGLRE